ncbi:DUF1611 domain-containing protein [Pseudidiomarina sp. 1APR75-15]|uniref:DUF1611 domain-containing protein n=1 Tax=Pseudidiomarina terrestris TaxID=2820060 RepID=A0ABT8MI87_9GAMM|nr:MULTISPECIES: DUF1611 domain-containing protein [unclassified Pseudidiomarina]MDN7125955.1 DUF1611 domain-containing protein [Pseudidiomarina sp. 1APR75-33.1]MDN7129645.1 DUF1611 domain-containing protein [Pseudidiomarina sp. 1APR75-15]
MNTIQIQSPYVIFLGDIEDKTLAKTGAGLAKWCQDDVLGQLRLPGCKVDLGLADISLDEAVANGAKSLVIGVATVGGSIHADWLPVFAKALDKGLDIVNGLHTDLATIPMLMAAQEHSAGRIINVRHVGRTLPIATGRKRTGLRLLTVGTDCAVGKKYTALELTRALNAKGIDATFRASGQTGIMIAGEGLPIDSIVSDFVSGASELLSPDNSAEHWDIIEGQGSLFNPSFSAVSMGLLHGSQPDAFILCHDIARERISTCPDYPIPDLQACIQLHLDCARIVNPQVRCVGVSVNTSSLDPGKRRDYLTRLQAELELPCVDPLIDGCEAFVTLIAKQFHQSDTGKAHAES